LQAQLQLIHPGTAAALLTSKFSSNFCTKKATKDSSRRTSCFFLNPAKLLKGEPMEMQQWISSVLHAKRRGAQAKNDFEATVEAERIPMQRWLQQTQRQRRSLVLDRPNTNAREASQITHHAQPASTEPLTMTRLRRVHSVGPVSGES
jgi:hypothetical protein